MQERVEIETPDPTHPPAESLPAGANFVDAFVIDLHGIARGKRLPASEWAGAARRGVAFSAGCLVLDARGTVQGAQGIGTRDGDPDGAAMPVPGTLRPVPWATPRGEIAQCLLSMERDGAPLWYDPRQILAGIIARLRDDGLHPVTACELEFYLLRTDARGRPSPLHAGTRAAHGHLCLQTVQDHADFLHALHAALAAQGITAGTLVGEYGPGQFEVNLTHHADPLRAADEACLLRRAVHGVARAHGLTATFMAKPYPGQAGSGLHIHTSLADAAGQNRFAADETLLHHAIGGMQAVLGAAMAVFAPNFPAWRRYRAGAFVATGGAWGHNSRAAALRIPPGPDAARRIEHRVACADASPHLAMACLLAGLHHGITQRVAPLAEGESLPAEPRDFYTALHLFGTGALGPYLPAGFADLFRGLKYAETADALAEVSDGEYASYL